MEKYRITDGDNDYQEFRSRKRAFEIVGRWNRKEKKDAGISVPRYHFSVQELINAEWVNI